MPKYTTNEFSFELPEKLRDRSLNIFSLTDEGPSDISIVISRSPVAPGATLDEQMAALISELGKQLASFRLLDRTERELPGHIRAGEIRYSHQQNGVALVQRQVGMLLPTNAPKGIIWIAITATLGPKASPSWNQSFDAMLQSLSFVKH